MRSGVTTTNNHFYGVPYSLQAAKTLETPSQEASQVSTQEGSGVGTTPGDDSAPPQQVMDICPDVPEVDLTKEGAGNPPPGQSTPLEMPWALVHGLAEASANVYLGTTISKGGKAQGVRALPRRPPSSRRSAKAFGLGKLPQTWTTPYLR